MTVHYDKPKTIITVDSAPVSSDIISTTVILRENGIADLTMSANNEEGKTFLNTIIMGAEISVSYWYADKVGDTVHECFRGTVDELTPNLSMSGEIVQVHAVGEGICLKDTRVASEFGTESKNAKGDELAIDDDEEVDGWSLHVNDWTHVNNSPWLHIGDSDKITIPADLDYQGYQDGDFTFQDFSCARDTMNITELSLNLRCRLVAGAGGAATSAKVRPSIHDGTAWHNLDEIEIDSTSWVVYTLDVISILDIANFDDFKLLVTLTDVVDGGATKGSVEISWAYFHIEGYGYNDKSTLLSILCDADIGIIPKWVEKMRWTEDGTPIDSGYTLDTSYVYDDPLSFTYLNFPFMASIDCLRDIINLLSAMRYPNAGPHFIISPDGKLLVAPINGHLAAGIPANIWANYGRDTALEVKKHNITENFKQEQPIANTVLVAGKFIRPLNELWTEGHKDLWRIVSGYLIDDYSVGNHLIGNSSLRVQGYPQNAPLWTTVLMEGLNINVESLGSKNNIPVIEFFGKYQGTDVNAIQLIIGTGTYVDNDVYDDYYYIDISTEVGAEPNWSTLISKKLGEWLNSDVWSYVGSPDWNNINYIGFRIHKAESTPLAGSSWLWVDGLQIVGSIIRCAYNSDSITEYGVRTLIIKDCLAATDTLDKTDDSSVLALVAKSQLIRAMHPLLHGKVMIELAPEFKAGQLQHCHIGRTTSPTIFQIDVDFRIVEVQHNFAISGATTILTLVDDLLNSISIGPIDAYNGVLRALNPDSQTKDMASLKFTNELDPELTVLAYDYAP